MNRPAAPDPKDIFLDALDVPLPRREEFIRKACNANPDALEHVRRLLAAHDLAQRFMADPHARDAGGPSHP
jgi:hypothetical protein